MNLDIKPVHDGTRNCLEDIYVTVAEWWGREYMLMFLNSWSFSFITKSQDTRNRNIGYRVTLGRNGEWHDDMQDKLLKRYHGIQTNWESYKGIGDILTIIENELENNIPVCFSVDSYWCPWNPSFQKHSIQHYCLAVGMDRSKEVLLCLDPYLSDKVEVLPFEYLDKSCEYYITFKLLEAIKENYSWKCIIEDALTLALGQNREYSDFDLMRFLASEIREDLDVNNDIKAFGEIWAAPIIRRMEHLCWGRKKFAKTLQYISDNCGMPQLAEISREIEKLAQKWIVIKGLFVKYAISPSLSVKQRIADKIDEMASLEEELAKCLLHLTKEC